MENKIFPDGTNYKKIEDNKEKNLFDANKNIFFDEYSYHEKHQQSKLPLLGFFIIFIVGIGLMFYPMVNNIISNSRHHYVISSYDNEVEGTSKLKREELFERAQEYNKALKHNSIQDVFSTDKTSNDTVYDSVLNITSDGLMGYIEIPKINIKVPIYHSTSEEVLEKGVGHLKGSSLPVGGIGTHAILAAHRGLPTSKLFSDLDRVVIGDKFYLFVLDEKLVYQVDSIDIVNPDELDLLDIYPDKDYVTLVTCTPYGINTQRLLVRGVRIEESEKEIADELNNRELIYLSRDDQLLIGISIILLIIIVVLFIKILRKKK